MGQILTTKRMKIDDLITRCIEETDKHEKEMKYNRVVIEALIKLRDEVATQETGEKKELCFSVEQSNLEGMLILAESIAKPVEFYKVIKTEVIESNIRQAEQLVAILKRILGHD